MNYEEIETINLDGSKQRHIILDLGDAAFKSFPADENNPEYVAWLQSQTPPKTSKSK
jgi:hypothetical protein